MQLANKIAGNLVVQLQRLRSFLLFAFFLLLSACAADRNVIGIDNPKIPAASVEGASIQKVFIASTRQTSEVPGALFSERRAFTLGLASVQVSIPPNHVVSNLERAKQMPPDPRREFTVVNPVIFNSDASFIRSLNAELAKRPKGKRDVLVFVHGFNNTTSDAVLRISQFVHDSGYEGVPVVYDWASAGKLTRYVYDLNSSLVARSKLSDLNSVLLRTNAENFDVFAHSMGGFLTMEAIRDAVRAGNLNSSGKLQNVILASPDIDLDLFRTQMSDIGNRLANFYVLLSEDDSALRFSRVIAGDVPRVGASNAEELARLGVTVIDLTQIDDSSSGSHSKFAGSPETVQLLGSGLNQHSNFERDKARPKLREMLAGTAIIVVGN